MTGSFSTELSAAGGVVVCAAAVAASAGSRKPRSRREYFFMEGLLRDNTLYLRTLPAASSYCAVCGSRRAGAKVESARRHASDAASERSLAAGGGIAGTVRGGRSWKRG